MRAGTPECSQEDLRQKRYSQTLLFILLTHIKKYLPIHKVLMFLSMEGKSAECNQTI